MNKTLIFVVIAVLVLGGGYLLMSQQKAAPQTAPSTGEGSLEDQSQGSEADVVPEDEESTTSVGEALPEEGSLAEDVMISGYAYRPATVRVKVGGTVTWTNQDQVAHTATADGGSFDTKLISQGKSASVTFDKAGTYPYHCTPHPNMKGTVIVE